jgi:Protein of unknown function (DUF2867)
LNESVVTQRSRLDELLPRYDFNEVHARVIAAPPDRVFEAVKTVTLGEMPLVGLLFGIRSLPVRLAGGRGLPRAKDEPLLSQMLDLGFTVLAEDAKREIVAGGVAQMWKRGGQAASIADGADFIAFDRPGYVKVATNFLLLEQDGDTRIETETRVLATDLRSRRGFARYWRLIRPGSGAIRRAWLRSIGRRAERVDDRPSRKPMLRRGQEMRLPNTAHTSRPWRIHELTRDFRLEDVWALPTPGGRDDFPQLVRLMASGEPARGSARAARALWAIRWKLGRRLRWDAADAGLGTRARTLRDRLPADLREAPSGPDFAALPFTSLYLLHDEWAAEIANRTMRGVMHVGWVRDETGGYRGQMAVLVKPNGLLGITYMAAIRPFRHLIVYPPMLRQIERAWRARTATLRRTGQGVPVTGPS